MNKILICILLLAYQNCIKAQVAKDDFARMNKAVIGATKLYIETEYKVFPNHYSQTPKEVSRGVMKQDGDKIYQQIASLKAFINAKLTVHIDTAEKIIVISDPINVENQRTEAMKMDMLSAIDKCKRLTYASVSDELAMYTLELKDNVETDYGRSEIYFNKKNFLPYKMVLYYDIEMDMNDDKREADNQTPRLEITFTKIETSPVFKDSEFNEKKFIDRQGNKILAASTYKGYKIIDNRYATR